MYAIILGASSRPRLTNVERPAVLQRDHGARPGLEIHAWAPKQRLDFLDVNGQLFVRNLFRRFKSHDMRLLVGKGMALMPMAQFILAW